MLRQVIIDLLILIIVGFISIETLAAQSSFTYSIHSKLSVEDATDGNKLTFAYGPKYEILVPSGHRILVNPPDESPYYQSATNKGRPQTVQPIISDYLVFVDDHALIVDQLGRMVPIALKPEETVTWCGRRVQLPGKNGKEFYVISTILRDPDSDLRSESTWALDPATGDIGLIMPRFLALNSIHRPDVGNDGTIDFGREFIRIQTGFNLYNFKNFSTNVGKDSLSTILMTLIEKQEEEESSGEAQHQGLLLINPNDPRGGGLEDDEDDKQDTLIRKAKAGLTRRKKQQKQRQESYEKEIATRKTYAEIEAKKAGHKYVRYGSGQIPNLDTLIEFIKFEVSLYGPGVVIDILYDSNQATQSFVEALEFMSKNPHLMKEISGASIYLSGLSYDKDKASGEISYSNLLSPLSICDVLMGDGVGQ